MQLTFRCPHCEQMNRTGEISDRNALHCAHCDWKRPFVAGSGWDEGKPHECLRCGNPDLWRQKDFPQSLGLACVAVGAITSSIAWGYHRPILALSILLGFALLDMVLYWVMQDVLVCYRCQTRHRHADVEGAATFDHELAERYRQERIRSQQARSTGTTSTATSDQSPLGHS